MTATIINKVSLRGSNNEHKIQSMSPSKMHKHRPLGCIRKIACKNFVQMLSITCPDAFKNLSRCFQEPVQITARTLSRCFQEQSNRRLEVRRLKCPLAASSFTVSKNAVQLRNVVTLKIAALPQELLPQELIIRNQHVKALLDQQLPFQPATDSLEKKKSKKGNCSRRQDTRKQKFWAFFDTTASKQFVLLQYCSYSALFFLYTILALHCSYSALFLLCTVLNKACSLQSA